jgi:hypothetical protein
MKRNMLRGVPPVVCLLSMVAGDVCGERPSALPGG